MRIVVDFDLCEANARCMAVAPQVFQLDDQDRLHLLVAEPDESLHDAVRTAASLCPRQAIEVFE